MTDSQRDFIQRSDPFSLFDEWLEQAWATESADANAMTLATVDSDGVPDARIVLLKARDGETFTFYTNLESAKGSQLRTSGHASLLFHWKSQKRQVRIRGPIQPVSSADADAYFASRHRVSRLGAIASQQSRPLESRQSFLDRVAELEKQFPGDDIPRPSHWTGTSIVPTAIEFWQDGEFRLHDRIRFTRETPGDAFNKQRLYP